MTHFFVMMAVITQVVTRLKIGCCIVIAEANIAFGPQLNPFSLCYNVLLCHCSYLYFDKKGSLLISDLLSMFDCLLGALIMSFLLELLKG